MTTLFFDCSMGAAGDMLSSALLDLFPEPDNEIKKLNNIGIPNVEYNIERISKCGINGLHLTVSCCGKIEGVDDENSCQHSHQEIKTIIQSLAVSEQVKRDALEIYNLVANAEANVHGCKVEKIHFHELGNMDAIADVVAASYLINELAPDRIVSSPIRVGFGKIRCSHGVLPVPAPATAKIAEGMTIYAGDIEGEMCTPTGAAIIKHFSGEYGQMPQMSVIKTGYGMGMRDYAQANCVRTVIGDMEPDAVELICNVDDMSPEDVGFALDRLMKCGALDAGWQSIGMKKNRPGVIIRVLCNPQDRERIVKKIFELTSTIGIRETVCTRYILSRHTEIEETEWGPVRTKVSEGYGVRKTKMEFDDIAAIAEKTETTPLLIKKSIVGGNNDA